MFKPNDTVGPYTLLRVLGEGQFGVVWLAERGDGAARRPVALKVLKDPDAGDVLQEVLNWARAGEHENILPIIDARRLDTPAGSFPVIVSNYVSEGSLRGRLTAQATVPVETALEISFGILRGIEHLHERQIIHRDLKPENVLMAGARPLLTDFGLARRHADGGDALSSGIGGTIAYMAPESFGGARGPQLDVWAAAVICYEMLAGHRPFPADPRVICTRPAPPLPSALPEGLRLVLGHALLQDEAKRRYTAAAELHAALREVVAGQPETATALAVPDIPTVPAPLPQEVVPPASPAGRESYIKMKFGKFETENLTVGPAASAQEGPDRSVIDIEAEIMNVRKDTKLNH